MKPTFRDLPATFTAAVCSGLILAALSPAHAQQRSDGLSVLPSVDVSAERESAGGEVESPKFTAPLLDTPQTVQVIPQEVFEEQGARNLTDVLRNTPGISFNAGENGFGTTTNNFSLRGFDTSGNIFVDGARDSGSFARDAFNIEQVEVVKGPAADNGRGGAGGYINLTTKTAQRDNFTDATVSLGFDEYDSDTRKRATVDINRTLTDRLAGRLNLMIEDSGVPGREHAELKSYGIAPSLAFDLTDRTRALLSLQHVRQEDRPDWGVPAAMIDGTINYDPVADRADRDTFYGLMGDRDDVDSDSVLARIEHRFESGLELSNQTRWSKTEREAFYTVPFDYDPATRLVDTRRQGFTRENTAISNLTDLSFSFNTGELKHRLSTGIEFTREKAESGRHPTPAAGDIDIFRPNPNRLPGGDLATTQTGEIDIRTAAVYAYDTIEFNPRWQLTGGLRVERYEVELESRNVDGTSAGDMDGYERSETTVGGKLGLVYKPRPNGTVYVSYGLSAVPPGSWLSAPDSSREGNNAFPGWDGQNFEDAREQKLINYEVGTKWDLFDRRLSASAALFRTERRDVAMRAAPGTNQPSGYGKQIVQGLELGLSGYITPAWSVFGGLVLLESERRHSAAVDAALASDYGPGITSTDGDELAFTPEFTANLWTTYRLDMGLTLGGGIRYVGDSYVGRPDTADRVIPNGQAGEHPSYTVVDLVAAYELSPTATLRLNIDNVTDETYATAINWSARRATLGAPRSFLLSADFRF